SIQLSQPRLISKPLRNNCQSAGPSLAAPKNLNSTRRNHSSVQFRRSLTRFFSFSLLFCLLASLPLLAEHTRRWRQSNYEEFLKGTAHGVAVRSDGRLELAPKVTLLADADASYLWSVRLDPQGMLYAAGGSPAKVFRFDSNGKPAIVFDSSDLSAQAIAFDSKGALYVGTSPDGKVYRVSTSGEKSVFFEPKTKYIWDLAFSPDGTLYVATGDKGHVFAVGPDRKGAVFYSSDAAHIRVLALDAQRNRIAGTDPRGRILLRSPAASTASAPMAPRKSFGLRAKTWSTSLDLLPMAASWRGPATAGLSSPSMVTAFLRISPSPAPRKSRASPTIPLAEFSCAPQILEKSF